MNKIIEFNKDNNISQLEPIYCAQDLRDYIGYKIRDVSSDEYDCNAKLHLINEETGERVSIDIDRALDGETMFVCANECGGGII